MLSTISITPSTTISSNYSSRVSTFSRKRTHDARLMKRQSGNRQPVNRQRGNRQPANKQSVNRQSVNRQAVRRQPVNRQRVNKQPVNGQSKLSCFQPLVSPPACPSAAAAAAETLLFLGNEHMTTAVQCKPFPAERNTSLHCNANLFLPSDVGRRLSRTYACGTPWLTLGNSTGAWRA